jgi:UPF0716 family protein affecting phage T7 exclusion
MIQMSEVAGGVIVDMESVNQSSAYQNRMTSGWISGKANIQLSLRGLIIEALLLSPGFHIPMDFILT